MLRIVVKRITSDLYQYRFVIAGLLLYVFGSNLLLDTVCPFANITGLPCPGCGMTRALLLLLHMDITGSIQYHPLLLPIACLLVWLGWKRYVKGETIKKRALILIVTAFGMLLVYIIRMFLFYPDKAPMIYRENNLMHYLWNRIIS